MSPFMNSSALDSLLQKLPYLRHLVETHGDMSLFDYGKAYYKWTQDKDTLFLERKTEFLSIVGIFVSWKFGQNMADTVTKSLSENYAVSTAEHHGPMGHPFFWQSTILRGIVNPDEAIINFCTSHVSLGNSSYPRGLVFHGNRSSVPSSYLHLPFFSASKRMSPVFGLWGYTAEDIRHHSFPRIDSYLRDNIITEEKYTQIKLFLNNFVLRNDILWEKSYSSQITRLNNTWWSHMFPDLPDFIPLDAEELISQILINHLERNTEIAKFMTNPLIQPFIEEYFDGISCCFDQESKRWTYLFWYLDEENNRHALWRENDTLMTSDKDFQIKLDTSSLIEHLVSWKLIPSWLLVYTLLSCYYQLTCFWGFSQGDYLWKIQKAYQNVLNSLSLSSKDWFSQWAILNEYMLFLFGDHWAPRTALDIQTWMAHNRPDMEGKSREITLKISLESMTEEILRCL